MFETPDATFENNTSSKRKSFGGFGNLASKLPILLVMVFLAWILYQPFPPFFRELLFISLVLAPLLRMRWYIAACLFLMLAAWLGPGYVVFDRVDLVRVLVLMGYIVASMRVSDMNFLKADADDLEFQSLRPLTAGWIWVPFALIVAVGVMELIPLDYWAPDKIGLLPNALRAISILWLLVVIWFAAGGLLNLASNRRHDPVRSKVYNRSEFCKQIGSELAGIEKRRAKLVNKRLKKR